MKAVICTQYGPPDVLQIKEVEKPVPKENEVMVKVSAFTVSAADYRVRSFTVPPSYWLPARLALGILRPRKPVLGMDFAGEVEAVGRAVNKYRIGDPVFGLLGERFGAYAQYLCISEDWKSAGLAGKPDGLSHEQAAAIPFGGLTALYFLRAANIQKGQKVLINGASGSVGTYAVQLAKYFGADVTAVCSTEKLALVESLGADKLIDYSKGDFTKSGDTYDVVLEAAGTASVSGCLESLTGEGTLLHAVATPAVTLHMKWAALTSKRKMVGGGPDANTEDLRFLGELVAAGKMKAVIDRIFPMEQIVEAHRYVETGAKKGNIVISLAANGDA